MSKNGQATAAKDTEEEEYGSVDVCDQDEEEDGAEGIDLSETSDSLVDFDDDELFASDDDDDDAEKEKDERDNRKYVDDAADSDDDVDDKLFGKKAKKAKLTHVLPKPNALQMGLKRKQESQLKSQRMQTALMNYIRVATFHVTGAPDMRKQVLKLGDKDGEGVAAMSRSIVEVEAMINETMLLARQTSTSAMTEICDFVQGADDIRPGPEKRIERTALCAVTQTRVLDLMCLQARRGSKHKYKIVSRSLYPLIRAVWVTVSFMRMIENKARQILDESSSFDERNASVGDAIDVVCSDECFSYAQETLKDALDQINMSDQTLRAVAMTDDVGGSAAVDETDEE